MTESAAMTSTTAPTVNDVLMEAILRARRVLGPLSINDDGGDKFGEIVLDSDRAAVTVVEMLNQTVPLIPTTTESSLPSQSSSVSSTKPTRLENIEKFLALTRERNVAFDGGVNEQTVLLFRAFGPISYNAATNERLDTYVNYDDRSEFLTRWLNL